VVNETEIAKLLEEGLRHYAVGDPSRALEAWFKVLEAVPQHARALEYVEYVRKSYRVDNDASSLAPIVDGAPVAPPTVSASETSQSASVSVEAPPAVELVDAVAADASTPTSALASGGWTVEVSHAQTASAPTSSPSAPASSAPAASSDWGVAATMDWGAVVDDAPSAGAAADAPPTASPPAASESSHVAAVSASSTTAPEPQAVSKTDEAPSSTGEEPRTSPLAPLPPTAAVAQPSDEGEPSGPVVVAARWTTEAQPAGAEDRAAHGGFEDPKHAPDDDWGSPLRPSVQVRAGSSAVVEIAEQAPESTPATTETASVPESDPAPIVASGTPDAPPVETPAVDVASTPASSTEAPSAEPPSVAAQAEPAAEVTVPEGRRPAAAAPTTPAPPATLLDASWGDIVDDAPKAAAPAEPATLVPAGAPPAMHVVVDERTPASTKVSSTEEGGPPPANPNELQSDDRSAPTLHLSDEPTTPPSPVQGGADVLVFPTPKSLETSLDKSANDDAGPGEGHKDGGDFSELPKTAAESDASPSTAEAEPVSSTEERYEQKPPAPEATALPVSPFRAVAIQESNEEWSGVHRSSRVSDSAIVVNPAEDARKVGVDAETSKPNKRAVVKDQPKRVLRFDSYEGDAVTSGEGLPVDDAALSMARLESEESARTLTSDAKPPSSEGAATAPQASASQSAAQASPTSSDGPAAFGDVPTTGPDGKPASPWDAFSGDSDSIDLDQTKTSRNVFEDLLSDEDRARRATENGTAVVARSPESAEAEAVVDAPPVSDTEPVNQCAALMDGARELFSLGDFSGSLELVEKVLRIEPENAEAKSYFQKNEGTLLKMYASKLGDLRRSPRVLTRPDEVIWMNLHHRAGFVLAQVDGTVTYEDLAEISGMSRLETYRILAELVQNGVITS